MHTTEIEPSVFNGPSQAATAHRRSALDGLIRTSRPYAPKLASIALTIALLAGDGLTVEQSFASPPPVAGGEAPTVDVPAPVDWGLGDGRRRGGQAARIEFEDPNLNGPISVWYRLAYIERGTRLQVFDHYAKGTLGPDSDIGLSEGTAWNVASDVVGSRPATAPLPSPPRVRTGNTTGPSAGLIFTLSYIDLLTSGALAGGLRVAGTGGIAADGYVFTVSGVEIKVATAILARPDVVFTPRPSDLIEHTTVIESKDTRFPEPGYTVGEWLNVNGYELAGREAATRPGITAFVVVHDVRQALAWLCGRTNSAATCAIAHRAASIPIGTPSDASSNASQVVRVS